MKTAVFLYNPESGKGKIARNVGCISTIFQAYGYDVTPQRIDFTANPFDGNETIDLMVVAGGVTAAIDFIYAIITVLRHAGDVTKIYLICFAVSVVLPVILINLLGLMGAVVSYLAIMALLLVLLIIEYAHIRQRIERDRNPYGA